MCWKVKHLAEMLRCCAIIFCVLVGSCSSSDNPVQPGEPVLCPTGFLCSLEPVAVAGGYTFSQISSGGEHSCALETTGEAYCWGSNRNGQLGNGSTQVFSTTPVEVAGGRKFTRITSGALHSCALTSQGDAYCWGNGDSGALGVGLLTQLCGTAECSRTPVQVIGGHEFVSIEAGFNHTCAVTQANEAYCWGANSHGELGTGGYYEGSSLPELVMGSHQFIYISAGVDYTCAIATDHKAWCWGSGANDALGFIPTADCPSDPSAGHCSAAPFAVQTLSVFAEVAAGDRHACGLTSDGFAFCWGDNGYGQIGVPGAPRGHVPQAVTVAGGTKLSQLSTAGEHSCAITLGSAPFCWGRNTSGELGSGSEQVTSPTPIAVAGSRAFVKIAAGGNSLSSHTCALTSAGHAYCWGSREMGQLGDGR